MLHFFHELKSLSPGCFSHKRQQPSSSMSLPCCPLYYGLRGTGPSGLSEVTAHTTCSDRLSPWLVCGLSGHAWRGRCIDLVAQTPSDTRERDTNTHITSNGTQSAHLHFHSQNLFTGFCAILCLMRLTVCASLI